MFEVIYKDVLLYTTNSKADAFKYLFMEAAKRSMEFHQEIYRYGRIDFIFYHINDENEFEVLTIIKS